MARITHTKVFHGADLLRPRQSFVKGDGVWVIVHLLILPQIALERGQNHLYPGTVLVDLCDPFRADVLERVAAVHLDGNTTVSSCFVVYSREWFPHTKAQHDHMRVLVGQRAQPIEFLLSGCIP